MPINPWTTEMRSEAIGHALSLANATPNDGWTAESLVGAARAIEAYLSGTDEPAAGEVDGPDPVETSPVATFMQEVGFDCGRDSVSNVVWLSGENAKRLADVLRSDNPDPVLLHGWAKIFDGGAR